MKRKKKSIVWSNKFENTFVTKMDSELINHTNTVISIFPELGPLVNFQKHDLYK